MLVPPLSAILQVIPEAWTDPERILDDLLPSLERLAYGYGIAVIAGVVLGVVLGLVAPLRDIHEPALEFLRAIPPPVLIPIIMLWAGIETPMKVIVILLGAIWPILLNTIEGVRAVDPVQSEVAQAFRARLIPRLRLILRAASLQIVAGARIGLSLAIVLMVVSEMFAAQNGIGFPIVQFQRNFAIPQMWSGVIRLGVLGLLLAGLFRLVERQALGWYAGTQLQHSG